MIPEKRLTTDEDMKIWIDSTTMNSLVDFVTALADSVKGRENSDYKEPINEAVERTMQLLQKVNDLIDKYPVIQDANTSRFGKVEFRDFYDDLQKQAKELVTKAYPSLNENQAEELSVYLYESWGNKRRIDYGSGHELNFICFLYGLYVYKVFDLERDATDLVLKVFIKYLGIMRVLETKYWLEPAGSHGVWGLDDYHFLPFLFGAHQLATHRHLRPKSIHNEEVVEMFMNRYIYFGCIAFINSVKSTASLRWHSPMLDDISGVKTWTKVAEGMIKMYKAEVLSKIPIMQHFYFGNFLCCPEGISPPKGDHGRDLCDEGHVHNTWGDCCGIKIPSAVAAHEAAKQNRNIIPFD
ncbi:hypothetical protein ZYGR_0AS03110 [Zygosaccharomyces rouxii]|uniref:Serine/threonine-protein phosphatase 2A activator n=1 Tax=Zygosaccharomyces rouxii TaxID=4956 RepID=A0A1Q3AH03_ZYGRO|nr:hypothetical protein ZYGR_0AS03110 [Zygosaccharomyces rouxii]